jgi:hypothetical protein
MQQAGEGKSPVVKATREGAVLDPSAVTDRRTEAEKKADEHFLKSEEMRARKAAAKSHRERIKELNEKLANLTEVRLGRQCQLACAVQLRIVDCGCIAVSLLMSDPDTLIVCSSLLAAQ